MEIIEAISKLLIPLIPISGIIMGGIVLIMFFKWYFDYKRFLIETGNYQPIQIQNFRPFILLVGILALSTGIPITLVFFSIYGMNLSLIGGLIPLFVGIGLIIFYIYTLPNK
ncbi:MAG: hypothetical protein NZ853_09205 [Leptospiraceae bacterium]|nr:hypothetical protein [Leptospiraceae bacterium]MDW7975606.1 hypothetical protein [Leptospiraceae bacterium]